MRKLIFLLTAVSLCLWISCQREKRFQVPPDIGRGLPLTDSLQAVLTWLASQKSYEAETLRFHYLYELITNIEATNPDTLAILAQQMGIWSQNSSYPLAKGLSLLSQALVLEIKTEYDSALTYAQKAAALLESQKNLSYLDDTYHLIGKIDYLKIEKRDC